MEEIVIFGHPSLRTKSSEITEFNNELEKLSERMIKIMYEAPGVGLAAPQIGINKNIFVFDAGDGPKTAIELGQKTLSIIPLLANSNTLKSPFIFKSHADLIFCSETADNKAANK